MLAGWNMERLTIYAEPIRHFHNKIDAARNTHYTTRTRNVGQCSCFGLDVCFRPDVIGICFMAVSRWLPWRQDSIFYDAAGIQICIPLWSRTHKTKESGLGIATTVRPVVDCVKLARPDSIPWEPLKDCTGVKICDCIGVKICDCICNELQESMVRDQREHSNSLHAYCYSSGTLALSKYLLMK